MSLEAIKIDVVKQLLNVENVSVLEKIKSIMDKEGVVARETIHSLTKEQELAIDEGLKSLEEHGGIPHEEVMNRTKKRYPNLFKK